MGMTPDQQEVYDLHQSGVSLREIARRHNRNYSATQRLYERAKKWASLDPFVAKKLGEYGVTDLAGVNGGWLIVPGEDGGHASLRWKTAEGESTSITELFKESLADYAPLDPKLYAPRINHGAKGEHLLVVDLADIHFGKLCETSETGHKYNVEIARHRTIEGTKSLLNAASGVGVGHILFVMGNDILHTDTGKTTTKGTPQDTDCSPFTAFKAAQQASMDAIQECAAIAPVDLLHCMSNHDKITGWMLSQSVAAALRSHDNVRGTDYNLSELSRKFYGYENNAFMLAHGDDMKEEKIYGHFVQEGRELLTRCRHLYAILHDKHHKMRRRRGVDVFESEKDHNGLTLVSYGAPHPVYSSVGVEYVRSPSPPDAWHAKHQYLNRQGVEAFMYHPQDGQKWRFTEWF